MKGLLCIRACSFQLIGISYEWLTIAIFTHATFRDRYNMGEYSRVPLFLLLVAWSAKEKKKHL